MDVIYSDSDIVVVYKPSGVQSQKSPGGNDMITLLASRGFGECFPVHRLDTPTQGLMVYARTKNAAAALSAQIAGRMFGKGYYAAVHGAPEQPRGDYEDLLFHDHMKNKTFVVRRDRNGVKKASLSYETVCAGRIGGQTATVVRVTLHTGRTHQIRVQFSHRGMPLFGDGKYGARDSSPLLLCCCELGFAHPVTGKEMSFSVLCPFTVDAG